MVNNNANLNFYDSEYCFVLGTRAELIKTAPVMQELNERDIPYFFISTGQHDLTVVCDTFEIKHPDVELSEPPEKSSKFNSNQKKALWWNFGMLFKIRREIRKYPNIKYVMYHGDTMTTCTASVSSSRLFNVLGKKWKTVHLEAGLRSYDYKEPFPEEISRVIADKFSDILFAPSDLSLINLSKYNKKYKVKVGNTIIDSANYAFRKFSKRGGVNFNPRTPFALVTVHRHENIKDKERLSQIVASLEKIDFQTFFMVHSNTKKKLEEFGLWQILLDNENVILCDPLDYGNFIYLLGGPHCRMVICDGGSMQEECMLFNIPCVVLRKKTERQEACDSGWQRLTDVDTEKIDEAIKYYLNHNHLADYPHPKNPYGTVGVSKHIVNILEDLKSS